MACFDPYVDDDRRKIDEKAVWIQISSNADLMYRSSFVIFPGRLTLYSSPVQ